MPESNLHLREKMFTPPIPGEKIISPRQISYWIGNEIGHGSFGIVFECSDDWSNTLAAKVLVPNQKPYDLIRDNWLLEIKNLLLMRHPNITFIYDAFEYRDTFYIITERCYWTIRDLIKEIPNFQGNLWIRPVARCLLQAVHYLHTYGYVHKDIHSGNVFTSLTRNEVAPNLPGAIAFKLGDLGISKLAGDINFFNTILAEWMLPPEYLKPEEFGTIDQRMDIYHCGLLFLQILIGKELNFNHDQIISGEPRMLAEGLPSPYGFAIGKALRRHGVQRTQSAMELWHDLGLKPSAGTNHPIQIPVNAEKDTK